MIRTIRLGWMRVSRIRSKYDSGNAFMSMNEAPRSLP